MGTNRTFEPSYIIGSKLLIGDFIVQKTHQEILAIVKPYQNKLTDKELDQLISRLIKLFTK
tara:strand:- start:572 stop:754 length:183 start_codon:yes stop_codon:yes gene_type:complete